MAGSVLWDEWADEDEKEARGRERSETAEESGEGASEAEGLVGGGEKVIWMPCVPTVQSRYDAASSKSVRSDILAPPTRKHTVPHRTMPVTYQRTATRQQHAHTHTKSQTTPRPK